MRFLIGTLFGLALSLVASRILAWRSASAAGSGDCANQLAEAEARRDALRARFQRKLSQPDDDGDTPPPAANLAAPNEPAPTFRQPDSMETSGSSGGPGSKPASSKPDDLTKIEGVGAKTAGVLNAAGIHTFTELANSSQTDLKRILADAGMTGAYGDPTTWPEQAALAAAGKWSELDALQAKLTRGRDI